MKKIIIVLLMSFLLVSCSKNNTLDEVNLFSSSLLAVTLDGESWGYVNAEGEAIIDYKFVNASAFYNDQAIVIKDQRFKLIDTTGKDILDETYDYLYRDQETGLLLFMKDAKWSIINEKGKVILEPIYEVLKPFKEGLSVVRLGELYGYINDKGEVAIDLKYSHTDDFKNGYAVTQDSLYRSGLIDQKGEIVLDHVYDDIKDVDLSKNVIVRTGSDDVASYDLISIEEQQVLLEDYKLIYAQDTFGSGKLYAGIKDQYRELYDHKGNKANNDEYIYLLVHGGYLISYEEKDAIPTGTVNGNHMFTLYDENLDEIITTHISNGQPIAYEKDNEIKILLAVTDDEYLDIYGLDKTYRLKASGVETMTEDLFIAKDGPFVGAYDRDLEVVIDFVYQSLKAYDDGFVLFRKLYLFGVMDKQYNIIINETYKYINADINVFFQPY